MKNNDWIVAKLNNPDFSVLDFQYISDLNLNNTLFLSKSDYLKSLKINNDSRFLNKDGLFDEKLFDQFYSKASESFKEFTVEDALNSYEYGLWDIERPKDGKVKNPNFGLSVESNPEHIRISVKGFNEVTPSSQSRRELALALPIYDSKNGGFLENSVNDISLLSSPIKYIKSLFDEPLVYATYDEDTDEIDPITGKLVHHHAGEYKINDNGEYYTETLNGRSLIGKQVVSSMDYLTSEHSNINKYDFFDSDGLDKSIEGTVASLVATVALLFTPFSGAYSGLLVAREMSKTLPMIYGIVQGFLGNNPDSKLLNTIAGYGEKFTLSNSDYAQSQLFSLENFGKLVGDVATLWGQQRFIADAFTKLTTGGKAAMATAEAKAAAEYSKGVQKAMDQVLNGSMSLDKFISYVGAANFSNIGNDLIKSGAWKQSIMGQVALKKYVPKAQELLAKRMKIGLDLSLVYMALISNTDVYSSVLQHGGTPFEAAAIALGSTIGMFTVDKYMGLGEMFFLDDIARQAYRTSAANATKDLMNTAGFNQVQLTSKKLTLNWISSGINTGKKIVDNYFENMRNHTLSVAGKALGEGLEEASEEVVTDMSKYLGEIAGLMGYFSQQDYGAWDNMGARYTMSLLGGALGGGIFGVTSVIQNSKLPEFQNDLIYLIRQGKKNEIKKEFLKLYDSGKMGSKDLSTESASDKGGYITADEEHESLADYTLRTLNKIVDDLDLMLNDNDLNLSEDDLFDKLVLGEYRAGILNQYLTSHQKTSYITNFQQNFLNLTNQIILKLQEIDKFVSDTSDPSKRGTDFQDKLNKLKEELASLQEQKEYLFGEGSLGYVEKLFFALDIGLSGAFISPTKEEYIKNNLGKDIKDLTPAEAIEWDKKYKQYCEESKKTDLDTAFKLFKLMQKRINPSVQELNKLNLELDLKRFKEIIAKYPFDQLKGEFDQLDGETEEDITKLYKQENESDEEYAKRKAERKKAVDEYNQNHIHEWIKEFSDLNLDKLAVRLLSSQLGLAKKTLINRIVSGFNIQNNVKLAQKIREILINNGTDDDILDVIRDYVKEEFNNKYWNIDALELFPFENLIKILKKSDSTRGHFDDYITKNDIYEIFQDWIETSPEASELLKNSKDNLSDNYAKLYNLFSEYIYSLLNYDIKSGKDTKILLYIPPYSAILDNSYGKTSILDEFIKGGISYAVNRAVKEENGIEVEPNLDPVTISNAYKSGTILSNTDNLFGLLIDTINQVRDAINNDKDLEELKKLERESYAKNPALEVVLAISDLNIESTLEDIYELFSEDSDKFALNTELIEQLRKIFRDIELAIAFIHASALNTNLENPIGHNKFLNEYVKRHSDIFKNWEELPEINSDTAYLLINELVNYLKEINNWINLSNKNSGNLILMLANSKLALQKTKLDIYRNNRDAFKISHTCDLLDGYDDLELDDSFQSVITVESLLHNNYIKALNNGITLELILEKLIPQICNINNLNKQEHSNLDDKLKYSDFSDFDKLIQIICNFAISDKDFYTKIKDIITNTEGFVPISILEEVAKMVFANNGSLETINKALEFINRKLKIQLPILYNTSIVTGVAGAGKSYLLSHIVDENAWISGPTQNQIDGLSVYLPKSKQVTKEDLFKIILGDSSFDYKKCSDQLSGLKGYTTWKLKESFKVNRTDNAPKQLLIDEASHFNTVELLIIGKWAKENGVHVILISGSTQNGYETDDISNLNSEVCLAWRTPNLSISLRNNNILKVQNLKLLDDIITNLDKQDDKSEEVLNSVKAKGINLRYYNGDTFTGDWITDKLTDVSKLSGSIAFIGNGDSQIFKLLKENGKNPELIDPLNVQGQEYDYVIVDKNWNFGESSFDLFLGLRDLYTMTSRSKLGTIIIRNNLPNYITSSEDSYTYISDTISKALDEFKEPRVEELNNTKYLDSVELNIEEKPVSEDSELNIEEKPVSKDSELNEDDNSSEDPKLDNEVTSEGDLLSKFQIRCYGNVSYSGIDITEDKKWINSNNSHSDLGIFLSGETSNPTEQENLVRLLLQMKCLFQYGTSYWDRADNIIKSRFTKELFENAKFFIKVEEVSNLNKIIGLTDLSNDERAINNNKVVKLIAKIKDNGGEEWLLSLGGLANPKTWEDNKDLIKSALLHQIDEGREDSIPYYQNIDDLINAYTEFINLHTQSEEEIEVPKPNFSLMTTIIPKKSLFRLEEIDPDNHFSPYKYASHYSIDSDVYVITDDDLPNFPKGLKGKAVIFTSSNIFLSKSELKDRYINQRKGDMSGEVRMLVLDNLGVSFRSLYLKLYKGIYTSVSGNNKFYIPMKSAPTGARMYMAMWNFRANLKAFNNRYKTFVSENKLTLEDVHNICLLDNKYYYEIKGSEKYLSELDYRNKVKEKHPDDLDKLKLLWDFNDSLGALVREFRLGYNKRDGAYARKLTNLTENTLYDDINNVIGIYINPEIALLYESILDRLFTNIYDKIIKVNEDPSVLLDRSKLKGTEWFALAKEKGEINIPIHLNDNPESPQIVNMKFDGTKALSALTILTIQIGKFLDYQMFYSDFKEKSKKNDKYKLSYGDEELHWENILNELGEIEGIEFIETNLEGKYSENDVPVGVYPYNVKNNVGTCDVKVRNLFSLMFHGLTNLETRNDFTKDDLRATDAEFKYGFFADPLLVLKTDDSGSFTLTITSRKFFGVNAVPGMPLIGITLYSSKPTTSNTTVDESKPSETDIILTKINELKSLFNSNDELDSNDFNNEDEVVLYFIANAQKNINNIFTNTHNLTPDTLIYYKNEFKKLIEIIPDITSIIYDKNNFKIETTSGNYILGKNGNEILITKEEVKNTLSESNKESFTNEIINYIKSIEDLEDDEKNELITKFMYICNLAGEHIDEKSSNKIINDLLQIAGDYMESTDEFDKFRIKSC